MKHLLLSALMASAAIFLPVSCTPYPELPPPVPGPDVAQNRPVDPAEKVRAEQERARRQQEQAVASGQGGSRATEDRPVIEERVEDPEPPRPEPKPQIQVARPVPGKPGFVFSPFNNKIIDVKDFPSGTLVRDPNYPEAEKKYFRVP